jgi:hypothetical protein
MFRFWAGATASFFVGSLGVSGVLAAEFGSSLTPSSSSQPGAVYFLTDTNFSYRNSTANSWGVASGAGLAKTSEPRTFAFVDPAASSLASTGWSSTSLLEKAKSMAASPSSQLRTDGSTYLGMFGAMPRQSLTTTHSGASFVVPTGSGFGVEDNRISKLLK